ncbi:MAG: ABC transporter ATP-binding protein [Candidatus Omnitrophica bacterium]|nr:ABC transporter ATP-binding protein [Candidatus Omnitrophota bacterium]
MKKPIIQIRGLNFSYPDNTKALKDINLDIYEGESIGVIGPNGAGKSTLLLHLNGILNGSGSVRVFDLEMNQKNLMQIRKNVGLVFQDPDNQLFMPTVFDDVAFGPINLDFSKEEVIKAVDQALEKVNMQSFSNRISHHLSFGEKKKISIATVLSMEPKILVLDEPTSNLDPKSRRDLIELLHTFSLTKIIASHDLKMIQDLCQRIVILDSGSMVAIGDTESILKDETLLKKHSLEIY